MAGRLVVGVPLVVVVLLFLGTVAAPAYYAWSRARKVVEVIRVRDGRMEQALRGGAAAPARAEKSEQEQPEELGAASEQ